MQTVEQARNAAAEEPRGTYIMPCRPFGAASWFLLINGGIIVGLAVALLVSSLVVYGKIYTFELVVAIVYVAIGASYIRSACVIGKEAHIVGTARTGGEFFVMTSTGQRLGIPLEDIQNVHHIGNIWCWSQRNPCSKSTLALKVKACRILTTGFRDNVLVESRGFFRPPSLLISPQNGKELAQRIAAAAGLETVNLLRQLVEPEEQV